MVTSPASRPHTADPDPKHPETAPKQRPDDPCPELASQPASPLVPGIPSREENTPKPPYQRSTAGILLALLASVLGILMLAAFFLRWREWRVNQDPVDELFTAVLLLLNTSAWFMAEGDEEVQRMLRRDVLPVFVSLLFLAKVVLWLTPPAARLHTLVTNTGASLILAAFLVQSFKVFIEASTVALRRSRGKIQ